MVKRNERWWRGGGWWKGVEGGGKGWRMVEKDEEEWRIVESGGEGWKVVERGGRWWRRVEGGGERWKVVERGGRWWRGVKGGDWSPTQTVVRDSNEVEAIEVGHSGLRVQILPWDLQTQASCCCCEGLRHHRVVVVAHPLIICTPINRMHTH